QDTFARRNRNAELGRALVLVDIAPKTNPVGVDRILSFMKSGLAGFASLDEAASAVADYTRELRRAPTTDGLRKNLRQRADGRWYWHWDPRFVDGTRNPAKRPNGLLEEMVARLPVPTLLIRGSKSDVLTDEGVDAFRRAVPHAQHVDVAGAGHMVAGDRNDAFTDAILVFLRHFRRETEPRT
ncbi:MAG: alpha/beta hydrolase, partial [Rhodospirillales bacterium]|nr:alpha/beta hydrolase [Rhodospirillales bacterium]